MTVERGSWQLKVDRAEKHFKELESEVLSYTRRHAYRAERIETKKNPDIWSYVLRLTEQPDPNLAIIAGDVIHNLRSALDHIAVALAPRKRRYNAGFPIEVEDIWAKDESGVYLVPDDNKRVSYLSRTKGMPEAALTVIQELQPYMAPTKADRLTHPLAVLNKLENADKHRSLIVIATGLIGLRTIARHPNGQVIEQRPTEANPGLGPGVAEDGAEIARFGFEGQVPLESEVDVEVIGTPLIAIDVGLNGGRMEILHALEGAIDGLRAEVFPDLEAVLAASR